MAMQRFSGGAAAGPSTAAGAKAHVELEDAALPEAPPGQREDQAEARRGALPGVALLVHQVTARKRRGLLLRCLTGARGFTGLGAIAAG